MNNLSVHLELKLVLIVHYDNRCDTRRVWYLKCVHAHIDRHSAYLSRSFQEWEATVALFFGEMRRVDARGIITGSEGERGFNRPSLSPPASIQQLFFHHVCKSTVLQVSQISCLLF